MASSRMATEDEDTDDFHYNFDSNSNRYCIGGSSLPRMMRSRKRNSASAGLVDNFVEDFERKLKLTPSALERLRVADGLFQDPEFMSILMKSLPDLGVRKLATTCSRWQALAYKTLRDRSRNNAFSLLWIDDDVVDSYYAEEKLEFSFKMFFHNAYLGGVDTKPAAALVTAGQLYMPLGEISKDNCASSTANFDLNQKAGGDSQTASDAKVELILTYASANMVSSFVELEQDENKTMKSAAPTSVKILALSPAILATSPDCRQILDAVSSENPDRKMITSIMFPHCSHMLFECFVIPSNMSVSTSSCISSVVGTPESTKKPKVVVLYQYLNLRDSKPGILEVLQSLITTQGSAGFPMVTGIYDYLDANLNATSTVHNGDGDVVATGLLICGDDFCKVAVMCVKLCDSSIDDNINEMKYFYEADAFTTQYALAFFHNEVTHVESIANSQFKYFLDRFQRELPKVRLHGIGSLSGAHTMFVNPDANHFFNKLNERMMELTGTVDSKTSSESMEITLVLLSYQAD